MARFASTLLTGSLLICAPACGSDDPKAKSEPTVDAAVDVGSGGSDAGGGGSGGATMDASVDVTPDVTIDAVVDTPVDDKFADAPPRPGPTDPMAVVLFGQLDGVDLTGSYDFADVDDAGTTTDICGAASAPDSGIPIGFRLTRSDEFEGTVINVRYSDPVTSNPMVGTYDQFDWWDFTISRFAKIDGSTKLVTFRAGQVTTDSEVLGDVFAADLDGAGMLDAMFHITKARRVVDTDEGIKDGDLYLWIAGTCK